MPNALHSSSREELLYIQSLTHSHCKIVWKVISSEVEQILHKPKEIGGVFFWCLVFFPLCSLLRTSLITNHYWFICFFYQLREIWKQTQESAWFLPTLHPPRSYCLFLPFYLQDNTQMFPAFFRALMSQISSYIHIVAAFTPPKLSWDVPEQFHLMFRIPQVKFCCFHLGLDTAS